jgi:hypothetical protein
MVKTHSKKKNAKIATKASAKAGEKKKTEKKTKVKFLRLKKLFSRKSTNPHRTLKRSYREDYRRETKMPGMMHHIMASFKMIFKNWKLFLPLLIIVVIINVVFVGINERK